jgi:hypothetical protein
MVLYARVMLPEGAIAIVTMRKAVLCANGMLPLNPKGSGGRVHLARRSTTRCARHWPGRPHPAR